VLSELASSLASVKGADILVLSPTPTAPTDQGNRKRIHAVCSELKRRGARVHFVYFPQEWWFSSVPHDLVSAMSAQWDSFHLVPPRQPVYQKPGATDYTIDEWWDDAIGDYLQWLFKRAHFDAFIVNYVYLSKAFEYAPPRTLRILDTHDKFTGRRQLLQKNGVPPDFFYTTQDQEAIALDRAQLVWAIKDEEAAFYRSISQTPCITMPHIEPAVHTVRKRAPEDEGKLVVGMLGSPNAINVSNARRFVAEAVPMIRERGVPIVIRLAGGMCNRLSDLDDVAGVDLMGPVDHVETFYEAVDVVAVPLAFSTGLKIKAVEAIASGMPLIALGHALEGIPCDHPWQHCESMSDLVDACCQIATDPATHVPALEASTRTADLRIREAAKAAFDDTARRAMVRPRAVIAIGREFFETESMYREHVFQTINMLNQLLEVTLFVDQPLPANQTVLFEAFHGLAADCTLAVSPLCGELGTRSLGLHSRESSLADLVRDSAGAPLVLWALRVGEELQALTAPGPRVSLVVRMDTLRLFQADVTPASVDTLAERFDHVTLVDSDPHAAATRPSKGLRHMTVPWMLSLDVRRRQLDLIAGADQIELARVLAKAAQALHPHWELPRIVHADGPVSPAEAAETPQAVEVSSARLMGMASRSFRLPSLALDLSGNAPELEIYRETLRRAGAPVVTPQAAALNHAPTLFDWLNLIESMDRDHAQWLDQAQSDARIRYGGDTGWLHIWGMISTKRVFG